MLLDERTVSRKTPLDGRLEVSAAAAERLAAVGAEFALVSVGRAGRGRLCALACTCAKGAGGGHVHHFIESPLLTQLTPGAAVRVELDDRAPAVRIEPAGSPGGQDAGRDAAPLDAERWRDLAGEFRLVLVQTSWPTDSAELWTTRGRLTLAPADSARRAASRERRIGRLPRGDLQLAGTWDGAEGGQPPQPAELDAGVLYVGCRDCMDASPDVLRITRVSPQGFWDTWRDYQTGIARAVNARSGEPLADPAGFF